MSDEKPMTVKERMAALARASSGSSSVPSPGPPRVAATTSPGMSVAEKLAKMRRGNSSPGGAGGEGSDHPSGGCSGAQKPGLSRTITPPSAPAVHTQSPGAGQGMHTGGSSLADRIAKLNSNSSSYAPSPSARPPGTTPSALGRSTSASSDAADSAGGKPTAGGDSALAPSSSQSEAAIKPFSLTPALARSSSDKMQSSDSDKSAGATREAEGREDASSPAPPHIPPQPQQSPLAEGKRSDSPRRVSPGLAARMHAMKMQHSPSTGSQEDGSPAAPSSSAGSLGAPARAPAGVAAHVQRMNSESSVASGDTPRASEEKGAPPPPTPTTAQSSGSGSNSSRMSPGLAARMQALGAASGGPPAGSLSLGRSGSGSDNGGVVKKMGSVSLPGMGMPMPMLGGAMPPGGLAELKRRKKEAERAASGQAEDNAVDEAPEETAEQQPGELQHANLSRATMPQRRRPRKAARPFKAAVATTATPTATGPETSVPATVTEAGDALETMGSTSPECVVTEAEDGKITAE